MKNQSPDKVITLGLINENRLCQWCEDKTNHQTTTQAICKRMNWFLNIVSVCEKCKGVEHEQFKLVK